MKYVVLICFFLAFLFCPHLQVFGKDGKDVAKVQGKSQEKSKKQGKSGKNSQDKQTKCSSFVQNIYSEFLGTNNPFLLPQRIRSLIADNEALQKKGDAIVSEGLQKYISKAEAMSDAEPFTFADLAEDQRRSLKIRRAENVIPLFLRALPPKTGYIDHGLRARSEPGVVKSANAGIFSSLRATVYFKGRSGYNTNIGFVNTALLSNFKNPKKNTRSLIPEDSKVVFLFLHGGGTNGAGHHVATQLANYMYPRGVATISIDLPDHAEGPRERFKDGYEFLEWINAVLEQHVVPAGRPIFFAGHSMGADVANFHMRAFPTTEGGKRALGEELDRLLVGYGILSPPPHPATEGMTEAERFEAEVDLDEKITGTDKNFADRPSADQLIERFIDEINKSQEMSLEEKKEAIEYVTQESVGRILKNCDGDAGFSRALLDNNKISPLGGLFIMEILLTSFSGHIPKDRGRSFRPALFIMGEHDPLGWGAGNVREMLEMNFDLENVEAHWLGLRPTTRKGLLGIGHLIFDHHRVEGITRLIDLKKKEEMKAQGIKVVEKSDEEKTPQEREREEKDKDIETFALILEFISKHTGIPLARTAELQYGKNPEGHGSIVYKVLKEFTNVLAFRPFLLDYEYIRREMHDPHLRSIIIFNQNARRLRRMSNKNEFLLSNRILNEVINIGKKLSFLPNLPTLLDVPKLASINIKSKILDLNLKIQELGYKMQTYFMPSESVEKKEIITDSYGAELMEQFILNTEVVVDSHKRFKENLLKEAIEGNYIANLEKSFLILKDIEASFVKEDTNSELALTISQELVDIQNELLDIKAQDESMRALLPSFLSRVTQEAEEALGTTLNAEQKKLVDTYFNLAYLGLYNLDREDNEQFYHTKLDEMTKKLAGLYVPSGPEGEDGREMLTKLNTATLRLADLGAKEKQLNIEKSELIARINDAEAAFYYLKATLDFSEYEQRRQAFLDDLVVKDVNLVELQRDHIRNYQKIINRTYEDTIPGPELQQGMIDFVDKHSIEYQKKVKEIEDEKMMAIADGKFGREAQELYYKVLMNRRDELILSLTLRMIRQEANLLKNVKRECENGICENYNQGVFTIFRTPLVELLEKVNKELLEKSLGNIDDKTQEEIMSKALREIASYIEPLWNDWRSTWSDREPEEAASLY